MMGLGKRGGYDNRFQTDSGVSQYKDLRTYSQQIEVLLEHNYLVGMMMGLGKRGGYDNRFLTDSGKSLKI